MTPRRPKGLSITRLPDLIVRDSIGDVRIERYIDERRGVVIGSSVDVIDGTAWYHLSVAIGRRCTHLPRILKAFGMEGAEEDNDGATSSRNFWLAVEAGKDAA